MRRLIKNIGLLLLFLIILTHTIYGNSNIDFYFKGTFYQDWMGLKSEGIDLYNRISSRLKLTLFNKSGNGWTVAFDLRNRFTLGNLGGNQLIIYDAYVSYKSLSSKLFFSLGQLNLYDTAGIGELTGAIIGYKLNKYISLGGYGGFEPDIYNSELDTKYNKYGFFFRYLGTGAKQFSLSFNQLLFDKQAERKYIYSSLLFPLKKILIFYGNIEYEMNNIIKSEDRLTQLYLNTRINISRKINITANYSSGKGLDYHYFLLEQSKNPSLQNSEIERFYYNKSYGLRLSIKLLKKLRIFITRRESEMIDKEIKNHTTRFGISLSNIFNSGIFLYGNYSLNRGSFSESDSFYLSSTRNFGKMSLNFSFSNYFNGIRYSGDGIPEIFHYPNRLTLSSNIFYLFTPKIAVSFDYSFSFQEERNEQQIFIRLILKK